MKKYKDYIINILIRTLKTMCQTAIASIGTTSLISDVDWSFVVSTSLLAGLMCILMNIGYGKDNLKENE